MKVLPFHVEVGGSIYSCFLTVGVGGIRICQNLRDVFFEWPQDVIILKNICSNNTIIFL